MNFKKYTKKRKLKSINKRKLKNTNKRKLKNTNKKNTIRKRKYGGVKSKKRKSIKLSPPIIRKSKRIRHQEPDYEEENLNNTIEFMEENVADELPEEKLNNTTEFMEDVAYELPEEKLNNIENENINNISEFMEDVADELPEMKEEYIYQNNETTNYNMETLINSNQFQEYNEYKEYNIGSNAECGIIYNFFGIEKESYYVNDINFYIFHEGGDSYRPYISLFFDKQILANNVLSFFKTSARSNLKSDIGTNKPNRYFYTLNNYSQISSINTINTWLPTAGSLIYDTNKIIKDEDKFYTDNFIIKMSNINNDNGTMWMFLLIKKFILEKYLQEEYYSKYPDVEINKDLFDYFIENLYKNNIRNPSINDKLSNDSMISILSCIGSIYNYYRIFLTTYFLTDIQLQVSAMLGGGFWDTDSDNITYMIPNFNIDDNYDIDTKTNQLIDILVQELPTRNDLFAQFVKDNITYNILELQNIIHNKNINLNLTEKDIQENINYYNPTDEGINDAVQDPAINITDNFENPFEKLQKYYKPLVDVINFPTKNYIQANIPSGELLNTYSYMLLSLYFKLQFKDSVEQKIREYHNKNKKRIDTNANLK